jgi:hypothetical protein
VNANMTITNLNTRILTGLGLVALLFLFSAHTAFAQLPSLDCDPFPLPDSVEYDTCMLIISISPPVTPPPIGSASNPIVIPAIGSAGMSGAYNPNNNTYLIAATTRVSGADQVVGYLYNAINNTLIASGRIDQGSDVGSRDGVSNPHVVYNSSANQYFVVWEDERNGSGLSHIYGRLINGDGTPATEDFSVHSASSVNLNDLDYNPASNSYVVLAENNSGTFSISVDSSGTVGAPIAIDVTSLSDSQTATARNSTTSEYWVTSVANRQIWILRVNAATFEPIGSAIQVSNSTGTVSNPTIAYSPAERAMLIAWQDSSVSGIMGRMVGDSFIPSTQFAILTPDIQLFSTSFATPHATYNSNNQSFYLSAADSTGGTTIANIAGGIVLDVQQASAIGNGSATNFATQTGAMTLSSTGSRILAGNIMSPNATNTSSASMPSLAPQAPVDTDPLAELISQIYLWSLGAAGLLAALMIVLGGYYVMTAGGLVLLLASYLILSTINPDLTTFDFDSINDLRPPEGT